MKIFALLLWSVILLPVSFYKQTSSQFHISVTMQEGMQEGRAFLRYFTPRGPYIDSVSFTNGKFTLKGNMPDKLTVARIYTLSKDEQNPSPENTCEVWLEKGNIYIGAENNLSHASYSGSSIQLQFSELQKKLQPIKKLYSELDRAYEKAEAENNEKQKDKLLNEEYPALFREKQKVLGAFIRKYPSSLISAYKFEEFCGDDRMDLAIVEPVYHLLDTSILHHSLVEKAVKRIEINKKTAPGMQALEFSQADTSGKQITLSAFRGKYLLIDFWAGWCVPCRAENPHLRRVYDQYSSKGFEILGVSLDGERKRWTDAIIKDKLVWPQVSDLQIFDNTVAKQYGVISIPQNILISPEGKIIDWNLKGSVLDNTLDEIFK